MPTDWEVVIKNNPAPANNGDWSVVSKSTAPPVQQEEKWEPPDPPKDYIPFGGSHLANWDENQKPEDVLPMLGAGVGSLAGPIGTGTGSFVGQLLRSMIQKRSGVPSADDVGMSALQAVPDFLLSAGTHGAIRGVQQGAIDAATNNTTLSNALKARIARMFFLTPETAARSESLYGPKPGTPTETAPKTVFQATGSRGARIVQDNFTPGAEMKFNAPQQNAISQEFDLRALGTPETRASRVISYLQGGKNAISDKIRAYRQQLRAIGNGPNKVTYDVVTGQRDSGLRDAFDKPIMQDIVEPRSVGGPVYPTKSLGAANAFLDGMRKKYGVKSNADLINFPGLPESDSRMVNYAKMISDNATNGSNVKNWNGTAPNLVSQAGIHPLDIDTALDIKSSTGNLGYKDDTNLARLWKTFNRSLHGDIQESMKSWSGGNAATKAYLESNKLNTTKVDLYGERSPGVQKALDNPLSGINDVQAIMRDPVQLTKAISASPNPGEMRRTLAGEWIANTYSKSQKAIEGSLGKEFDPSAPLTELLDPKNKPIVDKLFSNPAERASVEKFFQNITLLKPAAPTKAIGLTMYHGARAALVFLPAAAGALSGHSELGAISSGGILGAAITLNQFSKRVLLNPEIAPLISRLQNMSPKDPQARALTGVIMGALKGVEVKLMDGSDGVVNEKGQVVPK